MNSAAFPAHITGFVSKLSSVICSYEKGEHNQGHSLLCSGETLLIPSRTYCLELSGGVFQALSYTEQSIVACWFTRHHNGHVREKYLRKLTTFDRDWVIAYVMALCGEYVMDILTYIWEHRDIFDRLVLQRWLRDNRLFYSQTRSRIVSYWDCYYRSSFPRFEDYVGSRLMTFFDDCLWNRQSQESC
ncbi:MAG: hypothetical protein RL693_1258 [Verrucomicrobiota bacterium]|jgi:hypothetical protein